MVPENTQAILVRPAPHLSLPRPAPARQLTFPPFCRSTTWQCAGLIFQAEGKKLLRMAQGLPCECLRRRVSIEPLWGVDWSAEMVLEHLIEVGSAYAETIIHLSHGESPWHEFDFADAMPHGGAGQQIVADYSRFLTDFAAVLSEDLGDRESTVTHPHPWHGDLAARGWHCLAAFDQSAYRHQMARILSGL